MAVDPILSSGFKLEVDPAGGTTYESIFAHVDIDLSQRAPRQDKTKQLSAAGSIGIREHVAGFRERQLSLTFIFDAADTQTGRTHAELYQDWIQKKKGKWRLTYPPIGVNDNQVQPLVYTGARRRTFLAVITAFHVRGNLGTVVMADVTLQICKTVTEDTA
jgi:hypothetical protein